MLFATSSFAMDGDNVSAKVAAAFKNDFSQANRVTWEKKSDFYFAFFQLNNQELTAAYNDAGEMVGTSRKIESANLPLALSLELTKKFNGYRISEQADELSFEGQTFYFLSVENYNQVVNLKGYSNGEMQVESKTKKEPVRS